MCPIDPTPHFGEIMQPPPDHDIPGGKPDDQAQQRSPDIAHRPALPDHPEQMAVDIEDEEADPVIDTGPGIADGLRSLNKQRG
jgi:hypothetical protein